jgi:SAM-dependent methyltransferase
VTAAWCDDDALVDGADVFDVASLWRYEAIVRLGLAGEPLVMAASRSPMSPQLLDFLVRNVGATPDGPVVDVGAGLAGIAEHVRRSVRRPVVAFDVSSGASAAARRLFPHVLTARADPTALPISPGSVSAVFSCGLMAAVAEADRMITEVRRVIRPGGRFVVIDLASASSAPVKIGSRLYMPAERIVGSLGGSGFEVTDQAVGLTSLSDWALADDAIAREIARQRRGDPDFEHWLDDRRRFERLMSSDAVVMIGLAAAPIDRSPRDVAGSTQSCRDTMLGETATITASSVLRSLAPRQRC